MQTKSLSRFRSTQKIWFETYTKFVHDRAVGIVIDFTASAESKKQLEAQEKKSLSWTAILLKSLAITFKKHSHLNKMITYFPSIKVHQLNGIHISLPVERIVDGEEVLFSPVVRNLDQKSLFEIQQELNDYRDKPISDLESFKRYDRITRLPFFVRKVLAWIVLNFYPVRLKLQSPFLMSNLGKWDVDDFYPKTWFSIGISAIRERKGQWFSKVNITFDHILYDGAPVARFLKDLKANIEQVQWLEQKLSVNETAEIMSQMENQLKVAFL